MLKSILIIFAMFFGVTMNVLADSFPKPTVWAEDYITDVSEPSDYFYKETRLECLRKGIEDVTGIIPSQRYLSAIALKVRNDVKLNKKRELLKTVDKNNSDYRFLYLMTAANYISTFGICSNEKGKNPKIGINGFSPGDSKIAAELISSNIPTLKIDGEEITNDTVSQMIAGRDYELFEKLFSNKVDDKNVKYLPLSAKQQKEMAEKGINYADNNLTGIAALVKTKTSFSNCIYSMQDYQKNNGVKSEITNKLVKPQELCNALVTACGYPNPIPCMKYNPDYRDDESQRPKRLKEQEETNR